LYLSDHFDHPQKRSFASTLIMDRFVALRRSFIMWQCAGLESLGQVSNFKFARVPGSDFSFSFGAPAAKAGRTQAAGPNESTRTPSDLSNPR